MDARVERRRGEADDDAAGARGGVRGCVGVLECAVSAYSRAQGVGGRGARLRVGSRPRPRRWPSQLRKVATRRLGSLQPRLSCTAVEMTLQLVEPLLRTVCCLFASGRLAFSCAGADRGSGRVDPSTSPRRSLPSLCTGHCSPSSSTFALDLDRLSDPPPAPLSHALVTRRLALPLSDQRKPTFSNNLASTSCTNTTATTTTRSTAPPAVHRPVEPVAHAPPSPFAPRAFQLPLLGKASSLRIADLASPLCSLSVSLVVAVASQNPGPPSPPLRLAPPPTSTARPPWSTSVRPASGPTTPTTRCAT